MTAAQPPGARPCMDCGGDNISWRTENDLWNRVLGAPGADGDFRRILCVACFAARAEGAGLAPETWRLVPWRPRRWTSIFRKGKHRRRTAA